MSSKKYVLCRPRGGLNDILCQIEMCFRYCRKHDRILLLDTFHSGLRDDFQKYFTFSEEAGVEVVSITETDVDLSAFPVAPIKKPITFDMSRHHQEHVLFHDSWGGGINSYWLLQHVIPTELLVAELRKRLAHLPAEFTALHIRATDLTTDHEKLLRDLSFVTSRGNILFCTDNGQLQDELKRDKRFEGRAYFVAELDPTSSERLHDEEATSEESNLAMLADLVAMAFSRSLYFTFTEAGHISGFSGLAYACKASIFAKRIRNALGLQFSGATPHMNQPRTGLVRLVRSQTVIALTKIAVRMTLFFREFGAKA